ncbi:12026_t:CDS:1, partial [Racocetra persica]
IDKLYQIMRDSHYLRSSLNEEQLYIMNEFLAADETIKALPTISQKHPNSIYVSKAINTQEIKSALNLTQDII